MSVLILDPMLASEYRNDREREGLDFRDEVWDGVLVVPPNPNNEHQRLVLGLVVPFATLIDRDNGDQALPGANVSDREHGWKHNYRIPDVVVCLAGGAAKDCGTHFHGGPDLAVEIVSPGEDPLAKLDFYAKVGTRELIVLNRKPWALELYQLFAGRLVPAGRSEAAKSVVLASSVLPLTFELRDAVPRPIVVVTHTVTGLTWTA